MIKQAAIATSLILFAGVASANPPSSFAQATGLQNCLAAAERDARFLRTERTYYVNESGESRIYYINGVGRLADGSGAVRIACETTASGRRVLDVSVDGGRYAPVFATGTELAAN